MHITFAGVGGSGKTTIAQAVVKKLEQKDKQVVTRTPFFSPGRPWWYRLAWCLYLLRYFDVAAFRILVLKDVGNLPGRRRVQRLYMYLIKRYHLSLLKTEDVDVVVYDEGIVHWAAPALVHGVLEKAEVIDLHKATVQTEVNTTLIVHVNTPPVVCKERTDVRHDRDMIAAHYENTPQEREAHAEVISDVVAELAESDAVEVLTVDGLDSPVHNAAVIIEAVEELERSGSLPASQ